MDGGDPCFIIIITAVTIKKFLSMFSYHPWTSPHHSVGSVFTSLETVDFVKQNSIEHILTSPYNLASNSLAEKSESVQTFKNGLKRIIEDPLET